MLPHPGGFRYEPLRVLSALFVSDYNLFKGEHERGLNTASLGRSTDVANVHRLHLVCGRRGTGS